MRFLIGAFADFIGSVALTGITLLISNVAYGQSWDYWPVFGAWFVLLTIGIVWFSADNGEFHLFDD